MQLELIMYTIRKLVEGKAGVTFEATYPPKDSSSFSNANGSDYHKFIIYTQRITGCSIHGQSCTLYLFYRNKRTDNGGSPVFSSCEFGMFSGKQFVSLFKHHIEQADGTVLTEAQFAQTVADDIIKILNV